MDIIFTYILLGLYSLSMVLGLFKRSVLSFWIMSAAAAVHMAYLVWRSAVSGHVPMLTGYEAIIMLGFIFSIRILFFQQGLSEFFRNFQKLFIISFLLAGVFMSNEQRAIQPVMASLQSGWMYIHIPVYLLGYVSLLSATLLSIVRIFSQKAHFALKKQMDHDVRLATFCMVAGLVTGAAWGQLSWGNYWSWDPKETWALINLLILSLYFHRHDHKFQAGIVIAAALIALFTFFGVPYILSGLHSY